MTLNFYPQEDGTFLYRDEVMQILSEHPEITFLSGGYHNLEFTRAGVTKGNGLTLLCSHLGVDIEETLACGDTQNDIDSFKNRSDRRRHGKCPAGSEGDRRLCDALQ